MEKIKLTADNWAGGEYKTAPLKVPADLKIKKGNFVLCANNTITIWGDNSIASPEDHLIGIALEDIDTTETGTNTWLNVFH